MADSDLDRAGVSVVEQRIDVCVLDGFELRLHDQPVVVPVGAQRLIALLGVVGSRTRSQVAAALWPDLGEVNTRGCLRTALWRLQHRLGTTVVVGDSHRLSLAPQVVLDTERFVGRAVCILNGSPDLPNAELSVAALETGELLPGWDDDWVVFERERLRQLRLHALEGLCARFAVRRRYGLALEAALAAVRIDPLRESARRAVIKVHLAEGNLTEARREYADFRRLLLAELQIEPTPELASLVATSWDPARGPAASPGRHRPVTGARDRTS